MHPIREATVSTRWLIPFLRASGQCTPELDRLAREGISLHELADPEARISHRAAVELIGAAATRLRAPELGLTAAERIAPADFDSLELALRACANLREALTLFGRCMGLVHGAQEAHLSEAGGLAVWELRITDDVEQPAVSNDFALASAFALCRRYLVRACNLREVRVRHASADHASAYARAFPGAQIRFGHPQNALVFERPCLDTPMTLAHSGLRDFYEAQVSVRLERMQSAKAISVRVRHLLEQRLGRGETGVALVAQELGLNVSALRRELADEGTTYRKLRDELRAELAERYLGDKAHTVSEVAYLLGFATVAAFSKAFRRGHAVPPSTYRANLRRDQAHRSGQLA